MSDTVIRVENISKMYRLGEVGTGTLRDDFNRWWHKVRGKEDPYLEIGQVNDRTQRSPAGSDSSASDYAWALKEVSFEVKQGEILGIIGRNGAGKSTLLKILSRVTGPTLGEIKVKGRIASLLEVGTGFNPELTGRDNIYLNGAILGMRKPEIDGKFEEIVDFAGVERYIDTPVKRYSSGMYVRLAFGVAAHLDPEILILDEVLAVGDAAFQEKCLGKMKQVSRSEGRTVLFVSHNMGAIQSICSRVLLVTKGQIRFDGKVQDAVNHYLHDREPQCVVTNFNGLDRQGTGEARITSIRLADDASNLQTHFRMGEPLNIILRAHFFSKLQNPILGVNIMTDTGIMVADCRSSHSDLKLGMVTGDLEFHMRIETLMLYPRTYFIEPWIVDARAVFILDWVRNAMTFVVNSAPDFVSGVDVNANHGISFIPTSFTVTTRNHEI